MENIKNFRTRWHFTHSLMLHSTNCSSLHFMHAWWPLPWEVDITMSQTKAEREVVEWRRMSCHPGKHWLTLWAFCAAVWKSGCGGQSGSIPQNEHRKSVSAHVHTLSKKKKLIFYVWKLRLTRSSAGMTELMRRDKKNKKKNPANPQEEQHADLTRQRGNKKEN